MEYVTDVRILEWTTWREASGGDVSETVELQKIACSVCGEKCKTASSMCGGGSSGHTPVMTHGDIYAHQWRGRPNPWIHATIDAPPTTVLSTTEDTQCHIELPFLLPQLWGDTNRDLPTWRNKIIVRVLSQSLSMSGEYRSRRKWKQRNTVEKFKMPIP